MIDEIGYIRSVKLDRLYQETPLFNALQIPRFQSQQISIAFPSALYIADTTNSVNSTLIQRMPSVQYNTSGSAGTGATALSSVQGNGQQAAPQAQLLGYTVARGE